MGSVLAVVADMTKPEDCQRFIAETVNRFGRLDILVNNAGTSNANHFERWTTRLGKRTWSLNCSARSAARGRDPHMKKQGGGRIINLTMVGGKQPGAKSMPTTISRAAGLAFTKALSKDMAEHNILVNTVSVGLIKSGQLRRGAERAGSHPKSATRRWARTFRWAVWAETEEAANVITFLASDAASYVTGTSINVDGDIGSAVSAYSLLIEPGPQLSAALLLSLAAAYLLSSGKICPKLCQRSVSRCMDAPEVPIYSETSLSKPRTSQRVSP